MHSLAFMLLCWLLIIMCEFFGKLINGARRLPVQKSAGRGCRVTSEFLSDSEEFLFVCFCITNPRPTSEHTKLRLERNVQLIFIFLPSNLQFLFSSCFPAANIRTADRCFHNAAALVDGVCEFVISQCKPTVASHRVSSLDFNRGVPFRLL